MIPLPLMFPDDNKVHRKENSNDRMYQWMIGDALLAYPLYGDDYEHVNARDVYLPQGFWMDYDTGVTYAGPLLLEDFEIPVEKTPLFVGRSGIVIEKIERQVMAKVYPVTDQSRTVYYGRDGRKVSCIAVQNPDWTQVTVWDVTDNRVVEYKWMHHAVTFSILAGHDYTLR